MSDESKETVVIEHLKVVSRWTETYTKVSRFLDGLKRQLRLDPLRLLPEKVKTLEHQPSHHPQLTELPIPSKENVNVHSETQQKTLTLKPSLQLRLKGRHQHKYEKKVNLRLLPQKVKTLEHQPSHHPQLTELPIPSKENVNIHSKTQQKTLTLKPSLQLRLKGRHQHKYEKKVKWNKLAKKWVEQELVEKLQLQGPKLILRDMYFAKAKRSHAKLVMLKHGGMMLDYGHKVEYYPSKQARTQFLKSPVKNLIAPAAEEIAEIVHRHVGNRFHNYEITHTQKPGAVRQHNNVALQQSAPDLNAQYKNIAYQEIMKLNHNNAKMTRLTHEVLPQHGITGWSPSQYKLDNQKIAPVIAPRHQAGANNVITSENEKWSRMAMKYTTEATFQQEQNPRQGHEPLHQNSQVQSPTAKPGQVPTPASIIPPQGRKGLLPKEISNWNHLRQLQQSTNNSDQTPTSPTAAPAA